jgi:hypothetical protein
VYVVVHELVSESSGDSEHEVEPSDPGPSAENVMLPVGADAVPPSVSSTEAVHVVLCAITTEVGEQVTVVDVDRFVTVTSNPLPSELVACLASLP